MKGLLPGGVAALGLAFGAQAAMIDHTALTPGQSLVNLPGFIALATGNAGQGVFAQKSLNGSTGVGVSGGGSVVDGEIDFDESILFISSPATPYLLNSFTVAFLYADGFQNDAVYEVAVLNAVGNDTTTLLLTVTSTTTATLSGTGGTVTNLSPGDNSGGGEWVVSGLSVPFTSLVFSAGNSGDAARYGDYAFVNFTYNDGTNTVPEPASLALLGSGLLGLGLIRRARRGGVR